MSSVQQVYLGVKVWYHGEVDRPMFYPWTSTVYIMTENSVCTITSVLVTLAVIMYYNCTASHSQSTLIAHHFPFISSILNSMLMQTSWSHIPFRNSHIAKRIKGIIFLNVPQDFSCIVFILFYQRGISKIWFLDIIKEEFQREWYFQM